MKASNTINHLEEKHVFEKFQPERIDNQLVKELVSDILRGIGYETLDVRISPDYEEKKFTILATVEKEDFYTEETSEKVIEFMKTTSKAEDLLRRSLGSRLNLILIPAEN